MSNTDILVIVAVVVALVLAGAVVYFGYRLRAERRLLGGASILGEVAEDVRMALLAEDIAASPPRKP